MSAGRGLQRPEGVGGWACHDLYFRFHLRVGAFWKQYSSAEAYLWFPSI
jgi:hypothetical protein